MVREKTENVGHNGAAQRGVRERMLAADDDSRMITAEPAPADARAPGLPRRMQRAFGRADVSFRQRDGRTVLDQLYQEGQAKVRLPKVHGAEPVAVFLNTAGGITGGDELISAVDWGVGTAATATSQAAERIYRSSGEAGTITTRLGVGAGATGHWLPQETILFDRSRLVRRISADVAADGELLMVETTVFGRAAMGEIVRACQLADHWRIRRGGRLIYADTFRIGGSGRIAGADASGLADPNQVLAGAATGGGASALATLVLVSPDAQTRLDPLRAILETVSSQSGASAWNGVLVARMISSNARDLRGDLVHVLQEFRGRDLPRPWYC